MDRDTRIEPILKEAGNHLVILEYGDMAYRLNSVGETPSPFTVESAYASVRTVDGRTGAGISAEELDGLIEEARGPYARRLVDEVDRDEGWRIPRDTDVAPATRAGGSSAS